MVIHIYCDPTDEKKVVISSKFKGAAGYVSTLKYDIVSVGKEIIMDKNKFKKFIIDSIEDSQQLLDKL